MTSPHAWRPVFRAGWQGRKLAALWTGALLATVGFGILAVSDAGPGALATGLACGGVTLAFALALEGFRWHYVAALDEAPDGTLRVRTVRLGIGRWTTFPPDALAAGEVHTGQWAARGMAGTAPWVPLRRRDRRLPLVLDLQGDVIAPDAARRLTGLTWWPDEPVRPARGRA